MRSYTIAHHKVHLKPLEYPKVSEAVEYLYNVHLALCIAALSDDANEVHCRMAEYDAFHAKAQDRYRELVPTYEARIKVLEDHIVFSAANSLSSKLENAKQELAVAAQN